MAITTTFNIYSNQDQLGGTTEYPQGDTVVIKSSKMDLQVYEYLEKKYLQLQTAGNPFATPTNIPNNISGGALGIWAGFSPTYDTLVCQP